MEKFQIVWNLHVIGLTILIVGLVAWLNDVNRFGNISILVGAFLVWLGIMTMINL